MPTSWSSDRLWTDTSYSTDREIQANDIVLARGDTSWDVIVRWDDTGDNILISSGNQTERTERIAV